MSTRPQIRMASEHDFDALVALEEKTFPSDRFSEDQIDYLLCRSRASVFVLESDGRITGASYVLFRKGNSASRLYSIAVDPDRQGKGHGIALLRESELEAARRGCDRMTLEVRQDNASAIRFYEKHGYTAVRTLPAYYEDGMAGLKMSRILDYPIPDSIQLKVPYHAQLLQFTCGPACVMMALKYFSPELELTRAMETTLWKEATLIFTASGFGGAEGYGLALSAALRGLESRLTVSQDTAPMLRSVRTPNKREVMRIVHQEMKRRAREAGVSSALYDYDVDDIVSALHRGLLPIALISTYRLTGDKVPHWVIITGFDRDHVYIHDSDADSYRKNLHRARNIRIERREFLRMSRYGKEVYRCLLTLGCPPLKM